MLKVLIAPLLGGIIGYVTNDLAIKMLFRPRNPIVTAGLFLFPILLIFLSGISLGIVQVRQQHRRWEIPIYVFIISVINFIVDSVIIVVATMMRDESLSGVWDVVKMYGVLLIICMIVGVVSGMLSSFITGIVCRTRR